MKFSNQNVVRYVLEKFSVNFSYKVFFSIITHFKDFNKFIYFQFNYKK